MIELVGEFYVVREPCKVMSTRDNTVVVYGSSGGCIVRDVGRIFVCEGDRLFKGMVVSEKEKKLSKAKITK